ncbi:hypothetical protein ZIOFF_067880 [Zingiber officinale]|uniref:hydroxymethylglutaryl-CoA lyase n=1 Tax=Zingiber officinale TaxID=94328 RepID=A0A8J5ET11_ZINOF|nr:hypothetical protein ZIOFF_067880 [Zingiber officinale]
MSSIEEALCFDNVPRLSIISRLQQCTSTACRPRVDEKEVVKIMAGEGKREINFLEIPWFGYHTRMGIRQYSARFVIHAVKVELIKKLASSGLSVVEATSFVSPKWVPQLADAKDVMEAIHDVHGVSLSVLTPNLEVSSIFMSESRVAGIDQSLTRYREVIAAAKELNLPVCGYLSCVVGCPTEGPIPPEKLANVAKELYDMGCYEISLGDTIGLATLGTMIPMLEAVTSLIPVDKIAVHFHDTYGEALPNILVALQMGISVVDSSVAGLGGCPYAKGASGNVATEDVVYMLHGLGYMV